MKEAKLNKKLPSFIAIEGCIGAGKTTIAKLLAEKYKAKVLLEETEKHPFLVDFYENPESYAFQTEVAFVLIHYHQLMRSKESGLFNSTVFSDFFFEKDPIFASLTLKSSKERELFKILFDYLNSQVQKPNLIIYIKAPTDFLFERITKRSREFEKNLSLSYLDSSNNAYNEFFEGYDKNKLIIFSAPEIDFSSYPNALGIIISEIEKKIK